MFGFLRSLDLRREWLARKAPEGPLRAFYNTPYPSHKTEYREVEYLAVDLETTGLKPSQDEILSIGWVLIRNMRVVLAQSGHQLVKPKGAISAQSAPIHMITDDHVKDAPSLERGLERILPLLAGRVMVAHHSRVEWKFLDAACRQVYGVAFEVPTVDTLLIERKAMARRNEVPKAGSLRLDAVRKTYNLPRYKAHNAMIDAIAAAELFIAQAEVRSGGKPMELGHLSI